MKNIKHRLSKGFTLIELMVVISIISLLSSIVLASVKEVRERANANAFRASADQFIKGVELYRAHKGEYPGQTSTGGQWLYMYLVSSAGVATEMIVPAPPSPPWNNIQYYKTELSPYIKNLPKPIYIPGQQTTFRYGGAKVGFYSSCFGDTSVRPYVVIVESSIPGFEDWPYSTNSLNGAANLTYRCFSLK